MRHRVRRIDRTCFHPGTGLRRASHAQGLPGNEAIRESLRPRSADQAARLTCDRNPRRPAPSAAAPGTSAHTRPPSPTAPASNSSPFPPAPRPAARGRCSTFPPGRRTADRGRTAARHQPGQCGDLFRIEVTIENTQLLPFPRQHVEHRQPHQVAILQILDLIAKHDVAGRAIAEEQKEPAGGRARQHRLDDRQHRGDAGARRECREDARRGRFDRHAKASLGTQDQEGVALARHGVGTGGEQATGKVLDADAKRSVVETGQIE